MRGFQNGLLRSREANPELRTQKSRRFVIQEDKMLKTLLRQGCEGLKL